MKVKDKEKTSFDRSFGEEDERISRDIEISRKEDRINADKTYKEIIVNRGYLTTL